MNNAMLTRRTVLNLSAALAATKLASAQAPPAPATVPDDSPIGKLKSRRSEAKPITNEERQARVERAQHRM